MSAFSVGANAFTTDLTAQAAARTAAVHKARVAGKSDTEAKADGDAAANAVAVSKDSGLASILKWVPGEVIGTYAALVSAVAVVQHGKVVGSSAGWLVGFCAGAALLTWLGGAMTFRKSTPSGPMPGAKRIELLILAVLSAAGMFLWSYVIPGSATNASSWVNPAAVAVVVPFAAVLFGAVAEYLVLPSSLSTIERWASGKNADAQPTDPNEQPTTAQALTHEPAS
jgi:hypothetical protein